MYDEKIVEKLKEYADWLQQQIWIYEKCGEIKDDIQFEIFIIKYLNIKYYLNDIIRNNANDDFKEYAKYLIGCMNRFEIFTKMQI